MKEDIPLSPRGLESSLSRVPLTMDLSKTNIPQNGYNNPDYSNVHPFFQKGMRTWSKARVEPILPSGSLCYLNSEGHCFPTAALKPLELCVFYFWTKWVTYQKTSTNTDKRVLTRKGDAFIKKQIKQTNKQTKTQTLNKARKLKTQR